MVKLKPQLTLGVSLRDDATFSNYFQGDNTLVIDALKKCLSGVGESFIYMWGFPGVGRSHLLQACCHEMPEEYSAVYLDLEECQNFTPEILHGLDQVNLICIDNLNAVLNRIEWEAALFHFYNRAREQGMRLIVSGNAIPSQLPCSLADLQSRLSWGLSFQLKSLNDSQKLSALSMRAKNRGLILPDSAAQYLLNHTSRNLSEIFSVLELLEKVSLIEQRRLTIPFIKSVIR